MKEKRPTERRDTHEKKRYPRKKEIPTKKREDKVKRPFKNGIIYKGRAMRALVA
jgi:hypothetical protein